jgi:hypothetical protein
MNDLRLSIHQTFAQIGIHTNWATVDMHSPQGDLQIQQPKAKVEMHSSPGQLQIDSTAAWEALAKGPILELNNRIYSQMKNVALQAIAKIVEDGNRMAQITNPSNAFADIARDAVQSEVPIEYVGEAAYNNVKIHYEPQKADIRIEPQKPIIQYTPQKPDLQYNPGNVDVYLRQRQSIQITVTQYDLYK